MSEAIKVEELTPRRIVEELDKFIVGQKNAKKVVAIALRNRTRRMRLDADLQEEVNPKNIIMMGPTGVGKTEIARRLAKLVKAPFVKVEATKYTEVGYVGRDVESMVRDLVETSFNMVSAEMGDEIRPKAEARAREKLLDLLARQGAGDNEEHRRKILSGFGDHPESEITGEDEAGPIEVEIVDEDGNREEPRPETSRDRVAKLLDAGELDDTEVEFEISVTPQVDGMFGVAGMDDQMMGNLQDMMEKIMPRKNRRTRMKVNEARRVLIDEQIDQMLDKEKIKLEALLRAEQSGIIFVDEIDKVAGRHAGSGPDVSREGVQRDILPIVEGCTVNTKHGAINTDHILFIAAGAFHASKPSDLIPELQGRFPLRVELESLGAEEFQRILVEPEHSLIKQYRALLKTDGVELDFTDDGIEEIAQSAARINEQSENIGARRLHSILERVLEEVSYDAPDHTHGKFTIHRAYVQSRLADVMKDQDLSRFIL